MPPTPDPARPAGTPAVGGRADARSLEQTATASGDSRINQAGGDIYYAARDLFMYGARGRTDRRADGPAGDDDRCPYPGLAPFGVDQAQWYFGRDPLITEVVAQLEAGGPLAVVGPSGSGKSSLLMAGLRPALSGNRFPVEGSRDWPQLVLTPTAHPLAALAGQLAAATGEEAAAVQQALRTDPGGYTDRLSVALAARAGATGAPAPRLVVIVDQLEELFTLCTDDTERRAFIDAVSRMAQEPAPSHVPGPVPSPEPGPAPHGTPPPVLLVLGLRADFYGHAIAHPRLRAVLRGRQVLVGPMTEDELRAAIVAPAEATGLTMEPGLEELLLRDLGVFPDDPTVGDPDPDAWFTAGRLPLLAHALHMTWIRRSRSALTVADYQATGGIRQAISTSAERAYAGLDMAARQAAEALFLRLVRIGHGAEDTRRRASLGELATDGSAASATAAALTAFSRARLLTLDGAPEGGEPHGDGPHGDGPEDESRAAARVTVQITHEALIRAWPRLRRWIDRGRADILVRQELEEAARAWSEHGGSDNALLFRGSRLERATTAATSAPDHLSPAARNFLAASTQQAARAARLRRNVIAVLTALVLIASGTAVFAFQQRATAQTQRDTARKERDTAIAGQVAIEADRVRTSDPSLAALLDLASYRMRPDDDKYTNLLSWANGPLAALVPGATGAPAFSGDGRRMATRAADGSVTVWDSRDPSHPRRVGRPVPGLKSAADVRLSRDGRRLAVYAPLARDATEGSDGTTADSSAPHPVLDLWDVSDPAHFRRTGSMTGTEDTRMVAFTPDGREFITADVGVNGGTTTLWSLTDPARPQPGAERPGAAVALSHDGRTLAVWEDGNTLQLVDVSAPGRFEELLPQGLQVGATLTPDVAFSADGRWLATAGDPGGNGEPSTLSPETLRVWDLTVRTRPALHNEHQLPRGAALSMAMRPDGQVLATAGDDRTVTLWRVADTGLASSSLEEEFPHPLVAMYAPLGGHTETVDALAFSPDGSALASGDGSTVRVWDLPPAVATPGGAVDSITVLPGDRTLVAGVDDNSSVPHSAVGLWNLTNARGPTPAGRPTPGPDGRTSVFAVSPDGRTLATAVGDMDVAADGTTIALWSLADPARPAPLGEPFGEPSGASIRKLSFTADGKRLWSTTALHSSLWDISGPAGPRPLVADSPLRGNLLALGADGRLTLTENTPEPYQLWDTRDATRPAALAAIPTSAYGDSRYGASAAAFSADGRTLALSHDRTLRLWDVSDPHRPAALGGPMTGHGDRIESLAFVPHTSLLASASADNTVRLWDVSDLHHPAPKGRPLPAPGAGPLAPTHDGRTLITSSVAGTLRLWPLAPDTAAARVCAATANVLTDAVWTAHFPGIPYQRPCS
ncbi:AAA family ATPase [Streptomyces sp. NPDC008079]|uniref:nSTAND1 domain-containing NTPase n=1 Tax=Streptomyces sp. NPDC008079 TaxID=3364806 RepID=UPI0036EDF6C0